ncbi:MAG: hypothetical protein K1X88_09615 [Nannocystaceae bacterium]|nr:hypothetical protein [Nannocystaceae bacterium]
MGDDERERVERRDDEAAIQLALFRYGVIGPLVEREQYEPGEITKLVGEIAAATPYVLVPGDAPACPPELAADAPTVVAVDPTPLPCDCGCLGSCNVEFFDAGDQACSIASGEIDLYDGDCYDMLSAAKARNGQSAGGSDCDTPTPSPPVPAYGGAHRVCAGLEDGCVPVPGGALGPCLRKAGVVESCTIPGLPKMVVTMTDASIVCPACDSCSATLTQACEDANVTLHTESGCSGDASDISQFCSLDVGVSVAIDFALSCPPTGNAMPQPIDPVTYCCPQ